MDTIILTHLPYRLQKVVTLSQQTPDVGIMLGHCRKKAERLAFFGGKPTFSVFASLTTYLVEITNVKITVCSSVGVTHSHAQWLGIVAMPNIYPSLISLDTGHVSPPPLRVCCMGSTSAGSGRMREVLLLVWEGDRITRTSLLLKHSRLDQSDNALATRQDNTPLLE